MEMSGVGIFPTTAVVLSNTVLQAVNFRLQELNLRLIDASLSQNR
jgi:hypothetical protein